MPITTNYSEPKILDAVMSGASLSQPATYYFGLFTTAPTASTTGTEVTIGTGAYARVAVTNNSTNFPATSSQIKSNGTAINWPASTGAWGTIVAWGMFDASSGGNLWFYGAITPQTLNSGDTMFFAIGGLAITF